MNQQFSPQNNEELQQQQQPTTNQLQIHQQNNIKYCPVFYIQPNTQNKRKQNSFPMPNIQQQHTNDYNKSWFVYHPVMPDDPFFSYLSHVSNIVQKPQQYYPEFPIKIENDQVISQPQIQNQTSQMSQMSQNKSQQQQRLSQQKKQIKMKSVTNIQKASEIQPCNCSQSSCLKRYCACFHSGRMCLDECQCKDCKNCELFSEEREAAIHHVIKKCHRDKNFPANKLLSLQISYGCKCKSTGCQKKYCECFKRGQVCEDFCSCEDCLNIPFKQDKQKKRINIKK